jgi:hypothetical protein
MPLDLPLFLAGMPAISFTDVARPRLEVISFFLMALLASAAVVMLVWNFLARDFVRLPRLSYAKACGLVVLWGLLFVVVLTMISGARELMTPGAWEKTGATYKLRSTATSEVVPDETKDREFKEWVDRQFWMKHHVYLALMTYAAEHDGAFPSTTEEVNVDPQSWELPGLPGTRCVQVPGRTKNGPRVPLAYEPEVFDGKHFVLFTDGQVEELPFGDIVKLVEAVP